jgi:PRTRC genetic system protein F
VLVILERALNKSCRGCTPISAYGWCQFIYWQGEVDETFRQQEELADLEHWHKEEKKPFDRAKAMAELDIFTKAQFDAAIPPRFGSDPARPMSLARLQALPSKRLSRFARQVIAAAVPLGELAARTPRGLCDSAEHFCWEIVPYILRWSNDDPIPRIVDDVINNTFQAGEAACDVNAIWAFWDAASLRSALNRLRHYLRLVTAAEAVIKLIAKPA